MARLRTASGAPAAISSTPPITSSAIRRSTRALAAFAADASAVILDAHFTPDEMPAHKGWGHGDWSQCAAFASACGAEHLWLFHHKPGRTDDALKGIEAEARLLFAATDAAGEGDSFIV